MLKEQDKMREIISRSKFLSVFLSPDFRKDPKKGVVTLEPHREALLDEIKIHSDKWFLFAVSPLALVAAGSTMIRKPNTKASDIFCAVEYLLLAGYELKTPENIGIFLDEVAKSFVTLECISDQFAKQPKQEKNEYALFSGIVRAGMCIRDELDNQSAIKTDIESQRKVLEKSVNDFLDNLNLDLP